MKISRRDVFRKLVLAPIALVASAPIIKIIRDKYLVEDTWFLLHNKREFPSNEGMVLKWVPEENAVKWVKEDQ